MSKIFTTASSRRSFIRAGSSLIALPFLQTFATAQQQNSTTPKRLVFLGGGYGFTKESFFPSESGKFSEIGLPQGMKPLEKYKNDLTYVSNLHNPKITDPHAGTAGYLSGSKLKISCDQVFAQKVGHNSRFPSLVLSSAGNESGHGSGGISLSNAAGGKPMAGIKRPIDLYHKLFANNKQSPKQLNETLANKRSILDVVSTNASSIKHRVARQDKEKMEEYFDSLRDIEVGLQRQAEWSKVPKPKPTIDAPAPGGLLASDEITLTLDLIILALQTDSARVATYRVPTNILLKELEITISAHQMSHYKSSASKREASEKRDKRLMEFYAYFIDKLKATKDRNGESLYDTTIASYGSNLRTGHTLKSCPALLTGGGSTNLKQKRLGFIKILQK